MGFVATPETGHEAVALGVQALARLAHRGGLDADGKSGDGAGLLIQVPHALLGGGYAVVALFAWDERARSVVEESKDQAVIEKAAIVKGRYHILGGAISPLEGIGPDDLRIADLVRRLGGSVTEVIIATSPSVEGEATAMYLARLIKPLGVKVSRIATGLPVGGELEYTDQATIARALAHRAVL